MAANIELHAHNSPSCIDLSGIPFGSSLSGFVFKLFDQRCAIVHCFTNFEILSSNVCNGSNVVYKYKLLLRGTNLNPSKKDSQQNIDKLLSLFPVFYMFSE